MFVYPIVPSVARSLVLSLVIVLTGACGVDSEQQVQSYVTQSGLAFDDCGTVTTGHCTVWNPSSQEQAVFDCLIEAVKNSKAAKAVVQRPSMEGELTIISYFVEPSAGSTKVVVFDDSTQQSGYYGKATLTRKDCDSIRFDPTCQIPAVDECQDVPLL